MQEGNKTQGMRGESWSQMEAPQNYGFSSVVADAEKQGNGMIKDCAEGFMNFMGGNRNFPVLGVMDDRRHRLINLAKDAAKGAAAMFGLKEWGQQSLNTEDGLYHTGNSQKRIRSALVDNKNGQQQQQQQQPGSGGSTPQMMIVNPPGAYRNAEGKLVVRSEHSGIEFPVQEIEVNPLDAGGGGGGGSAGDGNTPSSSQPNSKATGQKTLHKEKSDTWHEMNKDWHQLVRGNGNVKLEDSKTQTFHKDDNTSTRCDDSHVHIRKYGMKIWVDDGGCHATVPITICDCSDGGGSKGGAGSGPGGPQSLDVEEKKVEQDRFYLYPPQPSPFDVTSSSPPIDITGGVVSMEYQAPIGLGTGPTPPLVLNYAPPFILDGSSRLALGPLTLDGGTF